METGGLEESPMLQSRGALLALLSKSRACPLIGGIMKKTSTASIAKRRGPKIRCGVVGYGAAFNMGRTHCEMIEATPGLGLVAICDGDPSRMAAAAIDYPKAEIFGDIREMVRKEDLDLVVLVTPHNTHADLGVLCARAGKHVITEKPMCLTGKEADRMIRAAKDSGTLLSVFHNRRWDGDYQALKKLVASGKIGEIFQVETFLGGYDHPGHWWRSDKAISGGCLYDWGAHFIDWVLNLIPSEVASVSGYFQKLHWHDVTNEDHTVAAIRFRNGALATVEISSLAAAEKKRWRILGTEGALTCEGWEDRSWKLNTHKGGRPKTLSVPFEKEDWLAYYRNIADHLIRGKELEVKAEQGAEVIRVIEAAERSSREGRAVVLRKE
jgi:predicted dehydrogenase